MIGASLGGGIDQSNAVSDAADTQAASSANAIGEQRRQYDLTRGDYAPYRAAGVDALGQLQISINQPTTAADVMADPGYQFGLDQGQQAIQRRIAASGGRVSGASIKAAARYGTDYATTGYTAADQRRNDRLNRLAALAGIGQTATGGSAMAGANAANNIASMTTAQGNATGASQIAQGNIWANTGNQIAALYGRGTGAAASSPNAFGGVNSAGLGSGIGYGNQDLGLEFSDARLKTNIRPIGRTARGNTIYAWDWKTGGSGQGVIAQEVQHVPGAVFCDADGLLMVDYSKV
jgi:hypothetical protein